MSDVWTMNHCGLRIFPRWQGSYWVKATAAKPVMPRPRLGWWLTRVGEALRPILRRLRSDWNTASAIRGPGAAYGS